MNSIVVAAINGLALGLASTLHCAGMCGPLALSLPAISGQRSSFLVGRLLYNLGRALTYTLLGVMFAGIILIGIFISLASTHRSVIKYLRMKLDDLY